MSCLRLHVWGTSQGGWRSAAAFAAASAALLPRAWVRRAGPEATVRASTWALTLQTAATRWRWDERGGIGRGRHVERRRRRREWEADGARRERGRRSRCRRRWGFEEFAQCHRGRSTPPRQGSAQRVPHRGGGGGDDSVVVDEDSRPPSAGEGGDDVGAARAVDVARLVGAVAGFPNGERDVVEGAIGGGELDNVGTCSAGAGHSEGPAAWRAAVERAMRRGEYAASASCGMAGGQLA